MEKDRFSFHFLVKIISGYCIETNNALQLYKLSRMSLNRDFILFFCLLSSTESQKRKRSRVKHGRKACVSCQSENDIPVGVRSSFPSLPSFTLLFFSLRIEISYGFAQEGVTLRYTGYPSFSLIEPLRRRFRKILSSFYD